MGPAVVVAGRPRAGHELCSQLDAPKNQSGCFWTWSGRNRPIWSIHWVPIHMFRSHQEKQKRTEYLGSTGSGRHDMDFGLRLRANQTIYARVEGLVPGLEDPSGYGCRSQTFPLTEFQECVYVTGFEVSRFGPITGLRTQCSGPTRYFSLALHSPDFSRRIALSREISAIFHDCEVTRTDAGKVVYRPQKSDSGPSRIEKETAGLNSDYPLTFSPSWTRYSDFRATRGHVPVPSGKTDICCKSLDL